jgi:hypothetical protein
VRLGTTEARLGCSWGVDKRDQGSPSNQVGESEMLNEPCPEVRRSATARRWGPNGLVLFQVLSEARKAGLVSCGALRHEAMAFDSFSLGWVADTCQAKTSSAAMSSLDTQPWVEMRIGDFWRQPSEWY